MHWTLFHGFIPFWFLSVFFSGGQFTKSSNLKYFQNCFIFGKFCSRHKCTEESKWNQYAKTCPILIILCALANIWPNLSNAHGIICIGHFFSCWFYFDSAVNLCLEQNFPKMKQFWRYFNFDDFVNCTPLKKTLENQNGIKIWKSIQYIWFKLRLKAHVIGFQTHLES